MNEFKIRLKRDINWGFIKRVLFCFFCSFLSLYIIYSSTGGVLFTRKHLKIFTLCAIPLSVIYALAVEKLGSGLVNFVFAWSSRKPDLNEQFSADLSKARLSKGKGEFREALLIVSEILEKHPDFVEALFLKAKILWEGYDNKELALRNLDKVMNLVKEDDPIHRWAQNYYHEVIKGRKPGISHAESI